MINPRNIHCLALNYQGVGDPSEIPLYFVKSLSCLCFSGAKVPYPGNSDSMWTEVELGIIVREDCENIAPEDAEKFIEGYTVCADVTCKNLYTRDHHLGFSKSRENFCPVFDGVVKIDKPKLSGLEMITQINGETTQKGFVRNMKYDPFKSFSFVSKITSLKKGDLILTGTPDGVENNIVKRGDRIYQSIKGIGSISYEIV